MDRRGDAHRIPFFDLWWRGGHTKNGGVGGGWDTGDGEGAEMRSWRPPKKGVLRGAKREAEASGKGGGGGAKEADSGGGGHSPVGCCEGEPRGSSGFLRDGVCPAA